MMNVNRGSVYEIAEIAHRMKMEDNDVLDTLVYFGITPKDGMITRDQFALFLQAYTEDVEKRGQAARNNLEKMVETHALLIDTCSLLHDRFPLFWEHLVPLLKNHSKYLIIPSGVQGELFSLYNKKTELREQIRAVQNILLEGQREGLVKVFGNECEKFNDKQLLSIATQYITENRILVITRDGDLSMDLLDLNHLRSVKGFHVNVGKINQYGYLSRFQPNGSFSKSGSPSKSGGGVYSISGGKPAGDFGKILPVHEFPVTDSIVCGGSGNVYKLHEVLAAGGEGTVYRLADGSVAKIYHRDKLSEGRRDKLQLMVQHALHYKGLCWPQELLCNRYGEFVGYRMEMARGMELKRTVFNRIQLEKTFPDWKKKDTVQLCITILETIGYLHRNGVILGDINPQNILVVSPEEVWFVDCDSYQVEQYACPVGTVHFTPPELQGKNFGTVLRTLGNENFAVATLLFMIMLPGKAPYAGRDGGDMKEAICNMEFPYANGRDGGEKAPMGAWQFIWSHMPRFVRNDFWNTFHRDGANSSESTRISVDGWLRTFRSYLASLQDGRIQANDPQSGELFPNTWRMTKNVLENTYMKRICVDCGAEFSITRNEMEKYMANGLEVPKRCHGCRNYRRDMRALN